MSSQIPTMTVSEMPKNVDYLVTRTGRRFNRKNLFNIRPVFPFLQLPPEIRNKVYRLILISADDDIIISDMDYRFYHHLAMHASRKILRTPYQVSNYSTRRSLVRSDANFIEDRWTTYTTSRIGDEYRLLVYCNTARDSSGLLRVSRQIRMESVPIFYGANTFYNYSEWALIPFLKDRTTLARASIRHMKLYFFISHDVEHHSRNQDCWIRNCKYMAQHLPHLESLSLNIVDFEGRLWPADQKYDKAWMGWVPAMMKIKVAKLEVSLNGCDSIRSPTSDGRGFWDEDEAAQERFLGVLKRGMLRDGPSEEDTGTTTVDSDDLMTWSDDEFA